MSNNIQSWKTKKMENLIIPIDSFFKHSRQDWHPKRYKLLDIRSMKVKLCDWEGCEIVGWVRDNNLIVDTIDLTGEGSGTYYDYIVSTALEYSTGELEAILIYESSDIYRLHVKDGIITETEIEL